MMLKIFDLHVLNVAKNWLNQLMDDRHLSNTTRLKTSGPNLMIIIITKQAIMGCHV
jgi:hypothetical protein